MDSDRMFEGEKKRPKRLFYYKQIVQIYCLPLNSLIVALLIFTHYLI